VAEKFFHLTFNLFACIIASPDPIFPSMSHLKKRNIVCVRPCELVTKNKKRGKDMKFHLTEEIWKEGNMYVSYCPELDISSCGEDIYLAKKNLLEAIQINIEETKKMGTFDQFLDECGLELINDGIFSIRKELVGFTPIQVTV